MSAIITCRNISKKYGSPAMGLKQFFIGKKNIIDSRYFREWALNDITFEVEKGEAFAVLGHNGTGKSTLLSLLLGSIIPDKGDLKCFGRVASLLELGAGFHPELSGYENIFLYGSILGMSISEIKSKLSRIIDFSELGSALYNPLRTYSSGMAARLGFSIIINNDADILLIDEVLAVGDAKFKKKCRNFLLDYKKRGGTLVIVSHEIITLSEICDTGIILDSGKLYFKGDIKSVTQKYTKLMSRN